VTVTAASFADPSKIATATINLTPARPSLPAAGVVNAATFQAGSGVAPGEIVTLFGTALGPVVLQGAQLTPDGTALTTSLAGTRVLFDGHPSPLVYSLSGQVSAIVPYEVAGQANTNVVVSYNGQTSQQVTVPVVETAPGLFTTNSSGAGPAAIVNQDGLVNSARFAAPRGSIVSFYGTGEGQTSPPGTDGKIALSVYPKPIAKVSMTIGGTAAKILYAGAAPDGVAGALQVNAEVPSETAPGDAVPVVLTIGNASGRSGVTMSVLGPNGQSGPVAYNNIGTTAVTINVYQPDSPTTPIKLGSVPGGQYDYVNGLPVGNDWWIQVNSSPLRIVSQVCDYEPNGGNPFWSCTGSASMPFPR
jgi:uncharacterized protein (TIGR03437 family)